MNKKKGKLPDAELQYQMRTAAKAERDGNYEKASKLWSKAMLIAVNEENDWCYSRMMLCLKYAANPGKFQVARNTEIPQQKYVLGELDRLGRLRQSLEDYMAKMDISPPAKDTD